MGASPVHEVGVGLGVRVGVFVGVELGVDVGVRLGVSVTSMQSQQLLPRKVPQTLTEPSGHASGFWMQAPQAS